MLVESSRMNSTFGGILTPLPAVMGLFARSTEPASTLVDANAVMVNHVANCVRGLRFTACLLGSERHEGLHVPRGVARAGDAGRDAVVGARGARERAARIAGADRGAAVGVHA